MLNHQQLILILSILNQVAATCCFKSQLSTSYRSLKQPLPKFASGPNDTITEEDYKKYFDSICTDVTEIQKANLAMHKQFKNFFQNMEQPNGKSQMRECPVQVHWYYWYSYRKAHRNEDQNFCYPDDHVLFELFEKLYHMEESTNELIEKEIHITLAPREESGEVLTFMTPNDPVDRQRFIRPVTFMQYGCINSTKWQKWPSYQNHINDTAAVESMKTCAAALESMMTWANFTETKMQIFNEIFKSFNDTFDALANIQDYNYKPNKSEVILEDQAKTNPRKHLAKMEMMSEKTLPFNPAMILVGSFIALFVVSGAIILIVYIKRNKKSQSFMRLEDEMARPVTSTNPPNAVIWSLENDQLVLIRK